jgi:hypothetical protein
VFIRGFASQVTRPYIKLTLTFLTSIWEHFKISNAVENYLQQEVTEVEDCFQTPAQNN